MFEENNWHIDRWRKRDDVSFLKIRTQNVTQEAEAELIGVINDRKHPKTLIGASMKNTQTAPTSPTMHFTPQTPYSDRCVPSN